jgi:serum/glucocorticoid-regulated kinase 2
MTSPQNYDYLNFSKEENIFKLIRNEKLIYSSKVIKINKFNFKQERNLLITNKAIYNLKNFDLKRRFEISKVLGITVSNITNEFIIHGKDIEYDYYFLSSQKVIIIQIVSKIYFDECKIEILFSQCNTKTLKDYVTLKNEKKKDLYFSRMPNFTSNVKEYCEKRMNKTINDISISEKSKLNTKINVCFNDFLVIKVLGRGSISKVVLVEFTPTKELYAMKCIKKSDILENDFMENILLEKKILMDIEHPFLVGLSFFFQNEDRIFFVLPYIPGGELYEYLKKYRMFDEKK